MPIVGSSSVLARCAIARGATTVSGLRKTTTVPRLSCAPRFEPPAKPRFSPDETTRTPSLPRASSISGPPSALSTTTTSSASPASESRQRLSAGPDR
jgi:hypothetical protein